MFKLFMKDRIYAFINLQPLIHCATRSVTTLGKKKFLKLYLHLFFISLRSMSQYEGDPFYLNSFMIQ